MKIRNQSAHPKLNGCMKIGKAGVGSKQSQKCRRLGRSVDVVHQSSSREKALKPSLIHGTREQLGEVVSSCRQQVGENWKEYKRIRHRDFKRAAPNCLLRCTGTKNLPRMEDFNLRRSKRINFSLSPKTRKSERARLLNDQKSIIKAPEKPKKISNKENDRSNCRTTDLKLSLDLPMQTRGTIKRKLQEIVACEICGGHLEAALMKCANCRSKYHLKCLGHSDDSANFVQKERASSWRCPTCVICFACRKSIDDPENVQCFKCDKAFHETCRPECSEWVDSNNPLCDWYCDACRCCIESPNLKQQMQLKPVTSEHHLVRVTKKTSRRGKHTSDSMKSVQCSRNELNRYLMEARDYAQNAQENVIRENKRLLSEIENLRPKKSSKSITSLSKALFICEGGEASEYTVDDIETRMKEVSIGNDYQLYMEAKRLYLSRMKAKVPLSGEVRKETNLLHLQWIYYGDYQVLSHYHSPYPDNLAMARKLYICRFCLVAFNCEAQSEIHEGLCKWRYPPGNEIYRQNGYSFWEVDGDLEMEYCRRLCLIAKLFLSSKTLYEEVDGFFFYILTENIREGCVMSGYFSKEKSPQQNNNLSCLVTLPFAQRNGLGKFLIDLSYKLSLKERKIGGPEHPLSDLGLMTYRSYWKSIIFSHLRKKGGATSISIKDLSDESGIQVSDLISTLLGNNMLKMRNGACLIDRKNAINAPLRALRRRVVKSEHLVWEPEFDVDMMKFVPYSS